MKYIFSFIFFSGVYCYLIIPLKYLPIYNINNSSHSEIYNSIINTKIYAQIEMGIPKQSIEIPLDFNSNDFYISDILFKSSNNKLYNSNIKYYNSSISISLFPLEDIYLDGNNFYLGEYSKDIFYFNDTKYELEFYSPIKLKKIESGGIGLLLNTLSYNSDRTFLKRIKEKGLIEDYYLSIIYNDDNVSLIIGKLPHELNDITNINDFNIDNLKYTNAEIQNGIIKNILHIDNIIINQNNKIYTLEEIQKIELDYHLGGIELPIILLPIYDNFFGENIYKQKCFKEELDIPKKISFFFCKNDNIIKNNIYQDFPYIEFYNKELNTNFSLDLNDLIYIKNNYIYFLLFFDYSNKTNNHEIVMGKPFLKKYQFSFAPDKKLLFYYDKNQKKMKIDEIIINNDKNIFVIIIAVIIAFITIFILFFMFLKFYFSRYRKKTKKAYELEDEYIYDPRND